MRAADLKPRTVGELLDAAFFVYRRRFFRLLLPALLASIPALVVSVIYAGEADTAFHAWKDELIEGARRSSGDLMESLKISFAAGDKIQPFTLMSTLLQSISRGASASAMAVVALALVRRDAVPGFGAMMRAAAPRMPAATLSQLAFDMLLGICIVCCPPVGIVLFVMVLPMSAVVTLERGPIERSFRDATSAAVLAPVRWVLLPLLIVIDGLVRCVGLSLHARSIGRGTAYAFFVFAVLGLASGSLMAAAMIAARSGGAWFWAQHYAETACLPVMGLARALWYFDLCSRREGLDLVESA